MSEREESVLVGLWPGPGLLCWPWGIAKEGCDKKAAWPGSAPDRAGPLQLPQPSPAQTSSPRLVPNKGLRGTEAKGTGPPPSLWVCHTLRTVFQVTSRGGN